MRRHDREVMEFEALADILRRADTMRLGLQGEEYPYVVPLSFGFAAEEGQITLYFHGAKEGLKHALLEQNPRVCVETDRFAGYEEEGSACSVTTRYESFIGFGEAKRVEGEEARKGIALLMEHCGYGNLAVPEAAMASIWVYQITLERFSGKRNYE